MNLTFLTWAVGQLLYMSLALIAIWGAFCVVLVWRRVAETRFRGEDAQDEFLISIEQSLMDRDFDAVAETCEGDPRALPQLVLMAIDNRKLGFRKVRQIVVERFQRDVLLDLEYRLSWVQTVIKSAPMVGLLGTVVGMMGAFAKLAASEQVQTDALAGDISLALVTTACGLAIAIPLVLCTASINNRIRRMEDLTGLGLTRFFEVFRAAVTESSESATGSRVPSRVG